MMRRVLTILFGFGVALGCTQTASAQINPFRSTQHGPHLKADDLALMDDAAAKLNQADVKPGQSETWSNPATGASGTVALARIFHSHAMTCHALHYAVLPKGQSHPRNYTVNWCLTQAGEWKIKS